MIAHYNGQITENVHAIGHPGMQSLLITAGPAAFDAGIGIMGPVYLQDLNRILGDAGKLKYVFLTHSHFDHCGSVPYLKRKIAGLKTGASRAAADVLIRPNAVALMRNLNRDIPDGLIQGGFTPDMEFEAIVIDFPFEDGQEFDLGSGYSFRVIATPGHTRDSISYYFPVKKILIVGEAAGILDTAFEIVPEFVSSYSDYLESLRKLASLETDYLLLGHGTYISGHDVKPYWRKSIAASEAFREKVLSHLENFHGDHAAVVEAIYREDYVARGTNLQPARSYLINLDAKVKTIAREES